LARGDFSTGIQHFLEKGGKSINGEGNIELRRFSFKICDYLVLQRFQEIFVKFRVIKAGYEIFFGDF